MKISMNEQMALQLLDIIGGGLKVINDNPNLEKVIKNAHALTEGEKAKYDAAMATIAKAEQLLADVKKREDACADFDKRKINAENAVAENKKIEQKLSAWESDLSGKAIKLKQGEEALERAKILFNSERNAHLRNVESLDKHKQEIDAYEARVRQTAARVQEITGAI